MSNKTMTLTEIEKSSRQFKDTHSVSVSGFDHDGEKRVTATYVLAVTTKLINQLSHQISDLRDEMRKAFAQVNARIDNLIVKNNLKE